MCRCWKRSYAICTYGAVCKCKGFKITIVERARTALKLFDENRLFLYHFYYALDDQTQEDSPALMRLRCLLKIKLLYFNFRIKELS